jgi:hypothetical protein
MLPSARQEPSTFSALTPSKQERSPVAQPSEESQTVSVQLIIFMVAMALSVLILVLGVVYFTGSDE